MSPVRVYLPLHAADLDALAGPDRSVRVPTAYAVTQRLERAHPTADEEQLEYAAFSAAVERAGADRGSAPGRRLVASADVEGALVEEARDPGQLALVRLTAPVPRRAVVSLHVDERPGGHEQLLWYDVTELDVVRALLD